MCCLTGKIKIYIKSDKITLTFQRGENDKAVAVTIQLDMSKCNNFCYLILQLEGQQLMQPFSRPCLGKIVPLYNFNKLSNSRNTTICTSG